MEYIGLTILNMGLKGGRGMYKGWRNSVNHWLDIVFARFTPVDTTSDIRCNQVAVKAVAVKNMDVPLRSAATT